MDATFPLLILSIDLLRAAGFDSDFKKFDKDWMFKEHGDCGNGSLPDLDMFLLVGLGLCCNISSIVCSRFLLW